jgi:peptidoglycan/LPS O-acetylase OafA/YrhL
LSATLVVIIGASGAWAIVQTSSNSVAAYFSPFTHAWELALGGLVAIATPQLKKIPRIIAGVLSWMGLAGIAIAALAFNSNTSYPGMSALLPVLSTAMVVACGASQARYGVEALLRLRPIQWLGKLSYSLYLWHWPVLAIVTQYAVRPVSLVAKMSWLLAAFGISVISYLLVENPIRHWSYLTMSSVKSIVMGIMLIGTALCVLTVELAAHP